MNNPKTYCYDYPRPMVTVDVVVFAMRDGELEVLLVRRGRQPYAGQWALPGGFVDEDEALEAAARRELTEETALEDVFAEQLYSFGNPGRDPRGRTISVAYYALMSGDQAKTVRAGDDAAEAQWFAVNDLPELAFDHDQIVSCARERLAGKIQYTTVAFHLLPAEFTLTQIQRVYEMIWDRELDRRNFRKWITNLDVLEETGRQHSSGRRPAKLYRLRAGVNDQTPIVLLNDMKRKAIAS